MSNSRVTLKAQATVPAQNKGTCNTYVGIVAFLGILVKDRIRESAYWRERIRRNSWNRLGCFQSAYYVVGPKINVRGRNVFCVLETQVAVKHQQGWEGELWSIMLTTTISSCSDSRRWPNGCLGRGGKGSPDKWLSAVPKNLIALKCNFGVNIW